MNGIIMPYFLNSTALNWGGKTGLFWAGLCAICLCWTFFRVPEPKGRTFGELDVLFDNHVSARKFKHTSVDQFAGHGAGPAALDQMDEKMGGKVDGSHTQHLEF